MFREHAHNIISEIIHVISSINPKQVDALMDEILKADKIVVCGAGRVGMAARGFGMRLGHLGMKAYTLGDSTVPSVHQGDLLLVASGSGETQTTYDIVTIAKKNGARVALITGNRDSRMGQLSDAIVELRAPSKTKKVGDFLSIQPMTTLNEQCLTIFFDTVVLELMWKMNESNETMWARHSNLE